MKFALLTSIEEYRKEIIVLLKKAEVHSFSYSEVMGYKDDTTEQIESNWFGSELNLNASLIFNIILRKEKAEYLFNLVEDFNNTIANMSKIHIAIINIEKTNEI